MTTLIPTRLYVMIPRAFDLRQQIDKLSLHHCVTLQFSLIGFSVEERRFSAASRLMMIRR